MSGSSAPSTNPDTSSPKYNPNAKCAYDSSSHGHETGQCWALKNKIQDLIDNKTIGFDPPPMPNVITAPMLKHDKGVNAVEDAIFVAFVEELTTLLNIIKKQSVESRDFSWLRKGLCVLYKTTQWM